MRIVSKIFLMNLSILMMFPILACENKDVGHSNPLSESGLNITVMATIPMVSHWTNMVSGTRVNVDSIMPHSATSHSYHPGAKEFAKISESDLIFAIGLKYEEAWLGKLLDSYPDIKLIELGEVVSPIRPLIDGNYHDQNDGRYDPHFWFDPMRVSKAVIEIERILSRIDPEGSEYYESNAAKYLEELSDLDKFVNSETNKISNPVMTEHDSLGYLSDRYGLEILRAIIPKVNPEVGSTPKDLMSAIKLISDRGVKVIFLEDEINSGVADTVSNETGIDLVSGLSVEALTSGQSYVDFMKKNIEILVSNLGR